MTRLIAPWLRTNGTAALVGTAYGVALYLVNFLVIAPLAYPVFTMANQPFELVVHAVFGTLLAFGFYASECGAGSRSWPCTADPARAGSQAAVPQESAARGRSAQAPATSRAV